MSTVLLDTVGLLALWDVSDQWHVAAIQASAALQPPSTQFVTTTLILYEFGNAAARKPYRGAVDRVRRRMISDGRLIEPSEADLDEAWASYHRASPGEAGIVDHVSFVIMRRLGIVDVFTNDRHFKAAGFNALF